MIKLDLLNFIVEAILGKAMKFLEALEAVRLIAHHIHRSSLGIVVDEGDEVAGAATRGSRYGTSNIRVNELKHSRAARRALLRNWSLMSFAIDTSLTSTVRVGHLKIADGDTINHPTLHYVDNTP